MTHHSVFFLKQLSCLARSQTTTHARTRICSSPAAAWPLSGTGLRTTTSSWTFSPPSSSQQLHSFFFFFLPGCSPRPRRRRQHIPRAALPLQVVLMRPAGVFWVFVRVDRVNCCRHGGLWTPQADVALGGPKSSDGDRAGFGCGRTDRRAEAGSESWTCCSCCMYETRVW